MSDIMFAYVLIVLLGVVCGLLELQILQLQDDVRRINRNAH